MNAIYPGSFDPVTNGHVNIARRSASIFGGLVVAVLDNPHKTPLFSVDERIAMLREVFKSDSNIEVDAFSGLLVKFAHKRDINVIIRGLRGSDDFSKELPYAIWNRQLSVGLAKSLETVYFTAEPKYTHISGSIVKEVAAHVYAGGHDDEIIAQAVPPAVRVALRDKYNIPRI